MAANATKRSCVAKCCNDVHFSNFFSLFRFWMQNRQGACWHYVRDFHVCMDTFVFMIVLLFPGLILRATALQVQKVGSTRALKQKRTCTRFFLSFFLFLSFFFFVFFSQNQTRGKHFWMGCNYFGAWRFSICWRNLLPGHCVSSWLSI